MTANHPAKIEALRALHQLGAEFTQATEDGRHIDPTEANDRYTELRDAAIAVGATRLEAGAAYVSGGDWEPFDL